MSKKKKEPEYYISPINTKLMNYKVYTMPASEKVLFITVLFLAGGFIGNLFYGDLFKSNGNATLATYVSNSIVFCVGGSIANGLIMPAIINRLKNKRNNQLKVQFRDFLSTLSTSLASGMNMNDSLFAAYNDLCSQYSNDSYIAKEVAEIINGIQNNVMIEESLISLGERSGITDIYNFGTVFSVCYRTGGNIKEVVKNSSDIISEKMMIAEEIETKLTSNKYQLYAMLGVPVIMMLLLRNMSSTFVESFASPIGIVAITVAIVFFVGAYKVGSKFMDIKG